MRISWTWTACLLLAAATLAGNGRDFIEDWRAARRMARTWEGRAFRGNGLHSDLRRELAEQHVPAGEAIYLMVNDGQDPSPMTRIIHQTLAWSRAPDPVAFGPPDGYGGEPFIMTAPFDALPDFASPRGRAADFDIIRNGPVSLWHRRGHAGAETDGGAASGPPRRTPSGVLVVTPGREALGLAAPLLAVLAAVLPWERLRQVRRRSHTACVPDAPGDPWQAAVWSLLLLSLVMLVPVLAGIRPDAGLTLAAALACGAGARVSGCAVSTPGLGGSGSAAPGTRIAVAALVALFVLAAGTMACSHTFLAPNGLGVQGGKARLLYLAGGLPGGFFTGAAHRTLQPAYPPGFSLLTLACYGMAGGCGEYLTQLLPIALAACTLALLATRGRAAYSAFALWVVATFLARPALRLTTQFYAEPLMALLVVAGWEALRGGSGRLRGWFLLGAAGWIKNEGLLFLPALWVGLRLCRGGRQAAPWRGLAAGLLLPLAWHLGCRLAGGQLYDFAPVWAPDPAKGIAALRALVQYTLLRPWIYGYVFPLVLVAAGVPRWRRRLEPAFGAAAVAVLLLGLAFAAIFALSEATDFDWHLASLKRLLWTPSLLLLRECAGLLAPAVYPTVTPCSPSARCTLAMSTARRPTPSRRAVTAAVAAPWPMLTQIGMTRNDECALCVPEMLRPASSNPSTPRGRRQR